MQYLYISCYAEPMNQEEIKRNLGKAAAAQIKSGMVIGLGSGSTSECFIQSLIEKTKAGLQVKAISSSKKSSQLAKAGGIEVIDINDAPRIDITVDGADEIDDKKRMIKGGGGCHVREKIVATQSDKVLIIVDESKIVEKIGTKPLPVELLFFGSPATKAIIEELGFDGTFRKAGDGSFFITDNGNLILDISFSAPPSNPEKIHQKLLDIPGVVDTGFFFNVANEVLVGYSDGKIEKINS